MTPLVVSLCCALGNACSANDGTPLDQLRGLEAGGEAGDSGSGGTAPIAGKSSGGSGTSGSKNSGGGGSGGSSGAGVAGSTSGSGGGGSGGMDQGGSGGSAPVGCGNVLDDFEDMDGFVCIGNSRNGQWFGYNNGGTAAPTGNAIAPALLVPARDTSMYAMEFTGTGTTIAGIGTSVARVGDQAIDYDATAFTGVAFWVRSATPKALSFEIQTADTDLVMYGGTCQAACASNKNAFQATADWTLVQIPFSSVTGGSSPLNNAKIRSINFVATASFDFWIDDVTFY